MEIDMLKQRKIISIFIVLICFIMLSSLYSQATDKKKIDRYFKMTLQEMMEVEIISASRTSEKVSDIPASVVLITREDIETYGYRTLTEILENIPGLYAIDDYEGGKNFGVRGFWSGVTNDNMIILVNNVPQVDDFQSNYPLTKITIPIEAIDRIEVVRGPMSVIYGNGAFYGVINIFTNDFLRDESKREDELMNIISGSYGSKETKKIFFRRAGKKDDFEYVLNASILDTYGIDQPLSEMVREPAELPNFGVSEDHRTGGRLERNEKYINISGIFKNFYFDITHHQSQIETFFLYPSPGKGNQDHLITSNITLGYKKKFSDKFSIDGTLAYFQNRLWHKYDFLFEDFFGIQQTESNAWEIDLNLFILPIPRLEVRTGLYYRTVLDVSNMYDLPSFNHPSLVNNYFYLSDGGNIVTRALFAQVNYKPLPKFTLVAGIRLEQMPKYGLEAILAGGTEHFQKVKGSYEEDKIEIIPRLAAIFSFNDKNHFKLLYGMAINRPSFFQNTKNSLDPLRDDLRPEKIQTLELNYIGTFSQKFTLSTSIFRNELENLITRVVKFDEEGNYQSWSANAGKMITYGIELTLNSEPFRNFRLELSGTYQKTDDKRPGYENIKTAYSPNFLGYVKAAYRTKKFTFALTGNYVDTMETYWDETLKDDDHPFGKRIGDKVGSYFALGANLRIEDIFIKGLYLNIRCSNLLDEEIRYPTFTNNQWADRGTLGISRTFFVSIGWKF